MAYGRPATVRSHRRGGPRRRVTIAPWVVVSLVVILVAGGLSAGYLWLIRQSCSGEVKATVVASPGTANILEGLSREWASNEPAVQGKCAVVEISAKDSAEVAIALQNAWDPKVSGPAPDAWVPQSTAWVRKAANDADAERMIPDRQPSIARSPTVLAMPKPMAEKLGWPKKELTWPVVLQTLAGSRDGWKGYGQPDWGPFKFGMTDPAKSTAGLLALTAILDADDDEEISDAEQQSLLRLKQVMTVYVDRTEEILNEFAKQSNQSAAAGLRYISAFPALEQDVLSHNLRNPKAPLVAIYPDNSIEADHPFLVLQNAPWTRPEAQQVATEFMNFVRGADGERVLLDAGFRDPNRVPGKDLTVQNGVAPQITALPRAVLLPDSVARAINTWTALTRPTNVLLVLDVSGSMKEKVPGTGKTRMALAQQAAKDAVSLFSDDARVGLWAFSSAQQGNRDYRVVTPLDRLGDDTGGGRSRRQQMISNIDQLVPKNDTGLYDTVAAAQKSLLDNFQKDAVNLVVVLTDGKNDDPTGGLSLDQLRQQLTRNNADPARRVSVTTVGFGDKADYPALQEIARLSGGIAFESREAFDINQVLLSAVFSDS
jgi:Ca-activated chloride channel family protein